MQVMKLNFWYKTPQFFFITNQRIEIHNKRSQRRLCSQSQDPNKVIVGKSVGKLLLTSRRRAYLHKYSLKNVEFRLYNLE